MPEYAKNQPAGFKNAIERVAIVGVSISLLSIRDTTADSALRLEELLDPTSSPLSLKQGSTRSQPSPAKTAATDSLRAS
jgi:hypothetical protein